MPAGRWSSALARDSAAVIGQDTTVIGDRADNGARLIDFLMGVRTYVVPTSAPGSDAVDGVTLHFEMAATTKNRLRVVRRVLVVAWNTDGANAHQVTITSNLDERYREGDIVNHAIPAGELHIFGPYRPLGWRQSDGTIHLEADDQAIHFAAIEL